MMMMLNSYYKIFPSANYFVRNISFSLQMMMMLNSYYKMLDDSLSKYSVYKAGIQSKNRFLFRFDLDTRILFKI